MRIWVVVLSWRTASDLIVHLGAGEDDQNVPADDAVADSTEAAPSDSGAASEASKENADADAEEDDAEIDFSAKKKKKKKPAKEAPVEESPEAGDAGDAGDADENQEQGDKDAGSDGEEDGDGEEDPSQGWLDSDRDYTYNEVCPHHTHESIAECATVLLIDRWCLSLCWLLLRCDHRGSGIGRCVCSCCLVPSASWTATTPTRRVPSAAAWS